MFRIIPFLLFSINVGADCPMGVLEFWPSGQTINQNPVIVIDGYSFSQKIIVGLNKKYPVYLKSGKIKVPLKVIELLVGEASLTQAVLRPESELIAGKFYQIHIDSIPENQYPQTRFWSPKTTRYEFPGWMVTKGYDHVKPVWLIKPKAGKKTYIEYGCGPAYFVHFNFHAADLSEILIKTHVTSISTGETITCYLKPADIMTLKVGKEMCYGAFGFYNGNEFEVSFDIMDASGNMIKWKGEKIKFTKPKVNA